MTRIIGIIFTLALFPLTAISQVSITVAGPAGAYTQNFNGAFLSTVDYNLTNNDPANLGWYATRETGDATPNLFDADNGSDNTGQFNNYGPAGNTDRAFGSLASNGTDTLFYGLRIQNDTGVLIRSLRVQFTGEQWRDGSNSADTLSFSYQVSAGDITSLTAGTWTNVTALDFVTPTNGNANAAIDGNAAANRNALDQAIFVDIPIGGEIMLRWSDINDGGNDHGLSIDDVNVALFVPSAAPVSISGQVLTADGIGVGGTTLTLTGGTLLEPIYARTNPLGYYEFDSVPSGSTYLLEATSKTYTFVEPSVVVNTKSNVTDLNFIALPNW